MTDLLQQGSDWLEEQRTRFMTRQVVYQRGAESVQLPATVGRTVFQTVDEHGIVIRTESRDYLVLADDLVLGGTLALPKAGDWVREENGGMASIYEVMAPAGESVYRFSDPYRRTLRIHSKLVGTEALS